MGLYLRKGFNFGPLRLNLSRSGLGTSVGVKGFRIGLGPRGAYLHAGRGGLYYRQSLGSLGSRSQPAVLTGDPLQPVESGDVHQMLNASAGELLSELNRVAGWRELALLAGVLVGAALGFEAYWRAPPGAFIVTVVTGMALVAFARHRDVVQGTAVLEYDLDTEAEARFNALRAAFTQFAACHGLWHVEAADRTDDWKRNAGAEGLVRRTAIQAGMGAPRRVEANIQVPTLPAGRQRLYFLPDQVLVYDGPRVGAILYSELRPTTAIVSFREEGPVPKDARVVGTTWKYVNKKGGPDRRFRNNREIPILQYGALQFESESGLREHFQCSQPEVAQTLARALTRMSGQ